MSPESNRRRTRSSKKNRTIRSGVRPTDPVAIVGARPQTVQAKPGPVRGGRAIRSIPTAGLAAIVVLVFAVGVGLASGAIRFGGGSGSPGSSGDAFGYGSGAPGPSAGSTIAPGASAGGGSGTPAGGIAGCPTSQPAAAPAGKKQVVKIATAKGTIEVTLVDDLSPIAAGNFAALASCGYYDGVVFHRIVPGFVIQGGDGEFGRTPGYDPSRAGTGGPGYTIQDEPVTTTYQRGTVAMARTAQANSVGSQFFIVLADAARTSLASANTYQIIGSVTTGMEVADAIAAAADNENPSQPIAMTTVTVASPTP